MSSNNDRQSTLVGRTLSGARRSALDRRDELRLHVVRDVWSTTKRFGSRSIANLEIASVPGVADAVIEGYIDDRNRAVLAALCRALGARTFFEIGTNRGRTAWTVARNNPDCHVYTLDRRH
jgi:tRNA G46 methylase TrmB